MTQAGNEHAETIRRLELRSLRLAAEDAWRAWEGDGGGQSLPFCCNPELFKKMLAAVQDLSNQAEQRGRGAQSPTADPPVT